MPTQNQPKEQQTPGTDCTTPSSLSSDGRPNPLENWRSQADGDGGGEFCWKDGALYRKPGHFGETRTLDTLRRRVVWPSMTMDVKEVCQACPTCQLATPATLKRAPLHPLSIIRTPFDQIAIDIFGHLRRTRSGNKYVLVIMDYAIKWPETLPLRNITSENIIECLIEVTSRLGVPKEVLSDNGTNFVSTMMGQFCDGTGIHQIKTSQYHPPDRWDGMGIHQTKTSPYHPQIDRMEREYTRSRRPYTTPRQMRWNGNTPNQDVPVPPPDRWDD